MSALEKTMQLMQESGLNARQLEIKAKLPAASFQAWKSGKANPSLDSVIKIADYFGVSVDYILDRPEKNAPVLTEQEQRLLYIFRNCPQSEQHKIMGYAEAHLETEKNK